MKQIAILARALALVLSFSILHVAVARSASPDTPVCGLINSDTTWTIAGSPYIICNSTGATIGQGVALTIDPGVTVQFQNGAGNGSGPKLNVNGALIAKGTAEQPITFTGVVANAGSWGGILASGSAINPAVIDLDNTLVEYGGAASWGEIDATNATVTIARSTIRNGLGSGFMARDNTNFVVKSTNFTNNVQDALRISMSTVTTDLSLTDLSASGNGTNGVHIYTSSNMSWPGQRRWANPGIPYFIDGVMGNAAGDILTIDPGSELRFGANSFFNIAGELKAEGTAGASILMTGQNPVSGSWRGIYANGGGHQAVIQLDYTTIEYAGSELANIELQNGQLIAHHSIIRDSSKDGVRFESNSGGSILSSQVYGNPLYGIYVIDPTRAVLATNDWWGDAGGPQSDVSGCSSGSGDRVTAGVLFVPVLPTADTQVTLPLSDYPALSMTPNRWFAPADGTSRVTFTVTLRDGNGAPLPGRKVKLTTTLGSVIDGGNTDANGRTYPWVTSGTTGDAVVRASLDAPTACEGALSPDTQVTFTTPVTGVDLMPDNASPYQSNDLSVSPLPVLVGVPTTITARLTNPLSVPVTTDVEFDFVQAGIGTAFGPIKTITGQVIPANSSVLLSATFTPSVSGHYCVQVIYNVTSPVTALQPNAPDPSNKLNLNVYQPTTGSGGKGDGLQKTRESLKNVNRFVNRAYDTRPIVLPLAVANAGIEWDLNNAEKISNALNGDPPRQDYMFIDTPQVLELPPIQAGDGVSPARATALNDLDHALAVANAYGTAAVTALDRAGGAAEAGDLEWQSTQTAAMLEYNQQLGSALITAAQKIDALISQAASEGDTSVTITVSDVITMQQQLAAQNFSSQAIADAHGVGLTDSDIEAIRQSILAANPQDLAGDVIAHMQQISQQFYSLGNVLANPTLFAPGVSVGGGGGLMQPSAGNSMAQVYDTVVPIPVYNPGLASATISLRVRRVDLPADWTAEVSPAQVTLGGHEQVDVKVSINGGSPLAQGSLPTVAVEGYIGNQLLGGVTIEVPVPAYRLFDGTLRTFLPVLEK